MPWISILFLFLTKILLLFQILIGNQNYKKHISCFLFDMVVLLFASYLFWRRIRHSWLIWAKLSANFYFFLDLLFKPWTLKLVVLTMVFWVKFICLSFYLPFTFCVLSVVIYRYLYYLFIYCLLWTIDKFTYLDH